MVFPAGQLATPMADETDDFQRSLSAPVLDRSRTVSGRVKWFNAKRGFGYIVHEDSGREVFVRRNAIFRRNPLKSYQSLDDGEEVDFVLRKGEKGWEAGKVTGPAGACVRGSKHTPKRESRERRGKGRKRRQLSTTASADLETQSSETPSLETPSFLSKETVSSPPSALSPTSVGSFEAGEEELLSLSSLEIDRAGRSVLSSTAGASMVSPTEERFEAPSQLASSLPLTQPRPLTTPVSLDTALQLHREGREAETPTEPVVQSSAGGQGGRHRHALHSSLRMRRKPQKQRSTRELSHSEVASLLDTNKFTRRLLSTPNVVSMSYTDEVKKGEKTGKKVLQVGVIKKLNKREVRSPNIRLPKEVLLGEELAVPVQVVEEGELQLFNRYSGGAQLKVFRGQKIAYGTLGARDKEKNHYRILSCAHVLTQFKEENIGIPISVAHPGGQPVYEDIGWRVGGQAKVRRTRWRKRLLVRQDLAWADVKKNEVSSHVFKIGRVSGKRRPVVGRTVKICGGYSGRLVTGAEIANTNATTSYNSGAVEFKKLCYIEGTYDFIEGDSGSAVIDEKTNDLVGIFMGATKIRAYFSAVVL